MTSLQRAHEVLERLEQRVHSLDRGKDWVRRGFARESKKLIAELREHLREADLDAWAAFEGRKRARKCEHCGGPIPATARADATTCGKRCRQARHRRRHGATARLQVSRVVAAHEVRR